MRTPEREVEEAIKSGKFEPEAIVELAFASQLEEREGEELEEYKEKKVGEIKALF